jgi:hypothetical protein
MEMTERMNQMRKQSLKGLRGLSQLAETVIKIAEEMTDDEFAAKREEMLEAHGLDEMKIYITKEEFIQDMEWFLDEFKKQIKILAYQDRQQKFFKGFKWQLKDVR